MRKAIIFLILVALLAAPTLSAEGEEPVRVVEVLHFGGLPLLWRPDWPAEVPPDAFAVPGKRAPRHLAVSIEASGDEDPVVYIAAWDAAGSARERPWFLVEQAYSLEFVYDNRGRVRSCAIAPHPSDAAPDGDASAGETVYPVFGPDGALLSAKSVAEGRTASVSFFREGNTVEELAYDEEGLLSGRVSNRFGGQLLVSVETFSEDGTTAAYAGYGYDAHGRVVRVSADEYEAEAFYDSLGRPLRRVVLSGPEKERNERRYQWDERGLLVREFAVDSEGKETEISYSYSFDSRGDWVVRESSVFAERYGIRAPERGARVVRKFTY
jgi:hypothetical protein